MELINLPVIVNSLRRIPVPRPGRPTWRPQGLPGCARGERGSQFILSRGLPGRDMVITVTARPTNRRVRSYVRRSGRITRAQRRALERHWPAYGVDGAGLLDLDSLFARKGRRVLEIGFGMGDALVAMAGANPHLDYLGIEVHEPGIGRTLAAISGLGLDNVRLLRGDAVEVLSRRIPDASLFGVLLFFPDPWPKKRHHKRRLVQPDFVRLVAAKLEAGGRFHLATDWQEYAEHMLAVLEAAPDLENLAGPGHYAQRPADRPETKFEQRGERLGYSVWDLLFARQVES